LIGNFLLHQPKLLCNSKERVIILKVVALKIGYMNAKLQYMAKEMGGGGHPPTNPLFKFGL
jgi:hypothetical protein